MATQWIKREQLQPGADILGSRLKGSVKIKNVRYPKMQWSEIIPGSRGILVLQLQTVEQGYAPEECNVYEWLNDDSRIQIEFAAKGALPPLDPNSVYEFEGDLIEDPQWGFQYNIVRLSKEYNLDSPEKVETFLRISIGNKKTDLLLENCKNPLELLEKKDIEALSKIKGVGKSTAEKLIRKYEDNLTAAKDATQLSKYELTPFQISSMQEAFQSIDTIMYLIEHNPYVFIGRVQGIGWKKADTIAINNGYNPNGPHRIAAYIDWYLREQANAIGHLWITLEELVASIMSIAPTLDQVELQKMLRQWTGMDTENQAVMPWLYYEPESRKIGLLYYRKMEEQIAEELWRLYTAPSIDFKEEEIEEAIRETEEECGFQYTDQQREAIYGSFKNNVAFITGYGGTGKTFSVKPIVHALKKMGKSFAQCALSGKAGSNLAEITGEDGYTIHRLLNWQQGEFQRNERSPIANDMIILDEISMVNDSIFLSLLKAIPTGSKLICLGDVHQLETIGPGSACMDILSSKILPSYHLTKIHRQAAQSGIITESIRVSAGEQIISTLPIQERRGVLQDLKIRTYGESILGQSYVLEEYQSLLEQGISPYDIGVVVAMRNRSNISCFDLNQKIQELVNGLARPDDAVLEKEKRTYIIRQGDRILVTENNYRDCRSTNDWSNDNNVVAIFNGNTGIVQEITPKYMRVHLIQQGDVYIPRKVWHTIELGYVLTCHKCVSGDTWILTDQGPIQLKELNNGALPGESLPLVNPPKVFNGKNWEYPSHFYNAGISKGYKITTRYNYGIDCTVDHGFDVYANGEIIYKKARDLKIGDYLIAPRNPESIGKDVILSLESKSYYSSKTIKFDDNNIYLPITAIEPIELQAYCLTMPESHKFVQNGLLGSNCQGSSFPYIITALDSYAYTLLSKEWLYTALTRAKRYCCLIGQIAAIRTATSTSRVIYKRTWLQELLHHIQEQGIRVRENYASLPSLYQYILRPMELQEMEEKMGKTIPYQEV